VPSEPTRPELTRADFAGRGLALFALQDGEGEVREASAPTTIPLAPIGDVEARDGRFFRLPEGEFERIRARTAADYPGGMPLDLRHDTEGKNPFSSGDDDFPAGAAAGWFSADTMRIEDGFVVADVEWTEPGARFVAKRLFRYISPVFFADPETRIVEQFKSAALTNNPALNMPALNEAQETMSHEQDTTGLRSLFGLAKDTTKEDLFAHCVALKEQAAKLDPALEAMARNAAELEATKVSLAAAHEKIEAMSAEQAETKAQAFAARRSAVIDEAMKAGKCVPAQVETYTAMAQDEDGLTRLAELFAKTPSLGLTTVKEEFTQAPTGTDQSYLAGFKTPEAFAKAAGMSIEIAQMLFERQQK